MMQGTATKRDCERNKASPANMYHYTGDEGLMQEYFSTRFRERVVEKGLDPDGLTAALVEAQAFIAGSFVLQVMFGEHWPDSDIDIFCQAERAAPLRKWLRNQKLVLSKVYHDDAKVYPDNMHTGIVAIENYNHSKDYDQAVKYADELYSGREQIFPRKYVVDCGEDDGGTKLQMPHNVDEFRDEAKNGRFPHPKEIQLITTKGMPTTDHFDIMACRSSFDGKQLVVPEPRDTWAKVTSLKVGANRIGLTLEDREFLFPRFFLFPFRCG
jgi:hypothetical protein